MLLQSLFEVRRVGIYFLYFFSNVYFKKFGGYLLVTLSQADATENGMSPSVVSYFKLILFNFHHYFTCINLICIPSFSQTLASFGVLRALEFTLAVEDQSIRAASVDILGFFVEFSPSMVRDYMMQQQNKVEEASGLLCLLIICNPPFVG